MSTTVELKVSDQMTAHIGTKEVKSFPMTKAEYCKYRGWDVPTDEDPEEQVYLIEYPADPESKPNHADHEGYISMSPKHVFDKAYRVSETYMDRIYIETEDLGGKIIELTSALHDKVVPDSSVAILREQLDAMNTYHAILHKRLK